MRGYSLLELLVTMALAGCVAAMALPRVDGALDTWRARGAAFFVAARVGLTRMQAVHRGANVALRFEAEDRTFRLRAYADGNDNGVRSTDIAAGFDVPLTQADRIDHLFSGVRFGFVPGARLIDGTPVAPGDDPIRLGSARMVACTPAGTATSGTIYVRGRRASQFAVVVLGASGRTRVTRFDVATGQWGDP